MSLRTTTTSAKSHAYELRRNLTDAEIRLWQKLRSDNLNGLHFRRQHAIGNYIADFCCPARKLIIELDGGQHLDQQDYDKQRTAFLESKGFKVLRFWDDQVFHEMDAVLQCILDATLIQENK